MKIIEASLLAFSKNFFEFKKQVKRMQDNGIKNIHYDVMDNIFVPNTAFNGEKLKYLKKKGFTISDHLMVKNVSEYVDKYLNYEIDYLTFHCEPISFDESKILLEKIKTKNVLCGIAIKPETKIDDCLDLIKLSDIVTVMGVNPGFGGQKYIESTTDKLKELSEKKNKNTIIQIDGGVNDKVIPLIKDYVNYFVSGSFLVASKDIKTIVNSIN